MSAKDVHTQSAGWQRLQLDAGETVCPSCKGAGRWDSCFDCGNRGYLLAAHFDEAPLPAHLDGGTPT